MLASVRRGGKIESRHDGDLAVCDASGNLLHFVGEPDRCCFMRSSAKPFQAVTCLNAGAAERFAWSDAEVALVCSSHSSEPIHRELAAGLLARAGLGEGDLGCGPHSPLGEAERIDLVRREAKPTPLWSNCSGKHAGMLATCIHRGWPAAGYLDEKHPLQRANLVTFGRFAGIPAAGIDVAVDGCGAPTFFVSCREMATAFARLVHPIEMSSDDAASARRIVSAMTARPELVAGTGRFDTVLGQFAGPRVVVKMGAEGVLCLGLPESGIGIGVKIQDGSGRAYGPIVARLLETLLPGFDSAELLRRTNPAIVNTNGVETGTIVAEFPAPPPSCVTGLPGGNRRA
jgi:L-asparaginase II